MTSSDTEPTGPGSDAARGAASPRHRVILCAAALAVWLWSTLSHGFGTELAHEWFEWAKEPGRLAAEGGAAGVRAAERLLEAVFVAIVGTALWFAVRRFRALPREERTERLLAWALWGAFVHLLWKSYVMFASEFIHFGQYGLVAALLYAGLGRGTRTVAAFLVATFLGVLDEAWQHWYINVREEGFHWHAFEWSDLLLNAGGACGGVMLVAVRPSGEPDAAAPRRLLTRAVAGLAVVTLPLLLLGRVALAKMFGSHTYHPVWNEYDIGKAAHWMTPVDGIPLFIASVLFLGRLVCGAREVVTRGVALALVLLGTAAIDRPSLVEGRLLHEDVPATVARRAAPGRVKVDGVLDEPEWAAAERLGPFVRNVAVYPKHPLPEDARVPLAVTTARILWDERALYVAFEMGDRDVWARRTVRDDQRLPGDEVVEVFVDPDGDEVTYHEFEFSPLGVVYDVFNYIPETPTDTNPSARFVGLPGWDAHDVECAVHVDGTLDAVEDWAPSGALDEDRGCTIEIAIPWRVFRTTTTPSEHTRVQLPPVAGDIWRVGLYRIERPRASPRDGKVIERNPAQRLAQYQAWSPTRRESFHRPERFGVVRFE